MNPSRPSLRTPPRRLLSAALLVASALLAAVASPAATPAVPAPATLPPTPAMPAPAATSSTLPPDAGTLDAAGLARAVGNVSLDAAKAVAVNHLVLSAGPARIELGNGILIPATQLGGRTIELVFVGAGRATLDPPDSIEAAQLDLFTGHSRLDEPLSAAVLVVGMDNATVTLLRRPPVVASAPQLATAEDLFAQWKKRERRVTGAEGSILGRAAGDPSLTGYFAALCRGVRLGDFLYVFDPRAQEQVTLGRFVPIDPTAKEKKEILKEVAREQQKGRLVDLDFDELGTWDTWISASPRNGAGRPETGAAAFEPLLYELDASLDGDLRLTGKARIELVPILAGARTVNLRLARDLQVSRVSLGPAGSASPELAFRRAGAALTVVLPRAYASGESFGLSIEYAGPVIEKVSGLNLLDNTLEWYPHAGAVDRARYAVTLHWPRRLTLVASGRHVAGGDSADGSHWEKRALDQPSLAFSFEIGNYKLQTVQAGHVRITLACDALAGRLEGDLRDQMLATVADALTYYESVFGPYPLDELNVVTSPRFFSQSTQGLVTLSDWMMIDFGVVARLYGVPDRRAIIAHEVAHQWWGDSVGWVSYRDQWISEALASYCAMRFIAHQHLDGPVVGMVAHWQDSLTDTIADGRQVESIGPVVLGSRLLSSLSANAYEAIVYDKGAVVFKTLESTLGADSFLRALAQVYKQNVNQVLSTETLVTQLGTLTSTDLAPFADQFIYGTGLRTVLYSYQFEPKAGGAYRVIGRTRQEIPRNYRYRVARTAGGALDVQRDAIADLTTGGAPLAVPAEIEIVDPARPPAKKGGANATVHGRFWVRGASSDFAIEVQGEPKGFFLDRQSEVFALFFDEKRHPRRSLLVAARVAAGQDHAGEAEALLAKALATDDKDEADPWLTWRGIGAFHGNTTVRLDHAQTQRRLTVEIQLARARLFLQQGRDGDAKEALDGAAAAADYGFGVERDVLLSWLDIHRGRFDSAFHRLHESNADTAESTLFLAIAAQATGHHEELEGALKAARRKGADATLLQPAPATAQHAGGSMNEGRSGSR